MPYDRQNVSSVPSYLYVVFCFICENMGGELVPIHMCLHTRVFLPYAGKQEKTSLILLHLKEPPQLPLLVMTNAEATMLIST